MNEPFDARTSLGAGNIQLVAGGSGHRVNVGRSFINIDFVRMSLSQRTPSSSPTGLAAGALLILLAVGYAVRRRLFS